MISWRKFLTRAAVPILSAAGRKSTATPLPTDGVIRKAGAYYLRADRAEVSSFNVRILADDVHLDLNGHTLSHGGPIAANYGIKADNTSRVTIRSGRIVGYYVGVLGQGSKDLVVEDVEFSACLAVGIATRDAIGLRVRGCTFQTISGWTQDAYAVGIRAVGANSIVEQSRFREIYRQPGAKGIGEGAAIIVAHDTPNVVIRNNRFENHTIKGERDIAVWVGRGSRDVVVAENVVVNFGRGIISATAHPSTIADNVMFMRTREANSNAIHAPAGAVVQNLIVGYDMPISGSPDVSGNMIIG